MNTGAITYIQPGQEAKAFSLVKRVADRFVCGDCTEAGIDFFFQAVRAMLFEPGPNIFTLLALEGGDPIGMITLRDNNHICLFFVDERHHGRGTGRGLLDKAIVECVQRDAGTDRIEVNSSPYAVPIYARLGFSPVTPLQNANGIAFVPMVKSL
jgi:GNAT superfamily N-acetyltransferase